MADDCWQIMSGAHDHFMWDKDRFRLVLSPNYPIMTISDHRNRKPGEIIDFCSFVVRNWEWASR
jgi:hypothetical protein